MRKPRPQQLGRVVSVSHYWTRLKLAETCATGHAIDAGALVCKTRAGYLKATWCEACAQQHKGLTPPPRSFVFRSEAPTDFRTRQGGEGD